MDPAQGGEAGHEEVVTGSLEKDYGQVGSNGQCKSPGCGACIQMPSKSLVPGNTNTPFLEIGESQTVRVSVVIPAQSLTTINK